MIMRLIDADELREQIRCDITTSLNVVETQGMLRMKQYCLNYIDDAPTVEAVPVKHGCWERRKSPAGFVYYTCTVCENCNWLDDFEALKKYYYCPHCGARVEWKGDNEGI